MAFRRWLTTQENHEPAWHVPVLAGLRRFGGLGPLAHEHELSACGNCCVANRHSARGDDGVENKAQAKVVISSCTGRSFLAKLCQLELASRVAAPTSTARLPQSPPCPASLCSLRDIGQMFRAKAAKVHPTCQSGPPDKDQPILNGCYLTSTPGDAANRLTCSG
jgi:hypothetical protein